MGYDEIAKQVENVRDDDDRCKECGGLLLCDTIEMNGIEYDSYYCGDSSCHNYRKVVLERNGE